MRTKLAALILALAAVGTIAATTAPAQAYRDTTWGCPTCLTTHR